MESANKTASEIANKVQETVDKAKDCLGNERVQNAQTDISTGVDKSLDLAKYWKDVALGKHDLVSATDKSIALAEYWTGFGLNLAKELVHKDDQPPMTKDQIKEVSEKLKLEMKTSDSKSDDLVNDAIADITTGIQKSLDLAKEWTGVALQKKDLKTTADRSVDLANYWTGFGLNLSRQLLNTGLSKEKSSTCAAAESTKVDDAVEVTKADDSAAES